MDNTAQVDKLKQKLTNSNLPQDVLEKLQDQVAHLEANLRNEKFSPEADRLTFYINFVSSLPWDKTTQDILDIHRAKQILGRNHYGLTPIKDRILEFLSILILNHQKNQPSRQPILAFVGLVGSGKTSLAYSIAESLGRKVIRIPFGGLGSALQLRGESMIRAEAEPGLIMKALKLADSKNPVILLDELDRVTQEARNDIMGVLVELLDPEQNANFLDHYVGLPFNLSQVLFIATANNTNNIATAVLDRMEVIEMPFYTDEEKIVIGRDYLLPEALNSASIDKTTVSIDPNIWPSIVRPLGFDGGIRSLKRNIDSLVRKIAKRLVEGNKGPYIITESNLKEFI